jgi:GNAT superfamily N-acetyltransferase
MELRDATADDRDGIAHLHADSWRRSYRGAYSGAFLDGPVVADRLAVWADRLSHSRTGEYTFVAEHDNEVVGFTHTILNADPRWGALLDNIHVKYDFRRQGLGARLFARSAEALVQRGCSTGLYLWVLEQNHAAQAFYEARGGIRVERALAGPFPGGGHAYSLRYAWKDLSQ